MNPYQKIQNAFLPYDEITKLHASVIAKVPVSADFGVFGERRVTWNPARDDTAVYNPTTYSAEITDYLKVSTESKDLSVLRQIILQDIHSKTAIITTDGDLVRWWTDELAKRRIVWARNYAHYVSLQHVFSPMLEDHRIALLKRITDTGGVRLHDPRKEYRQLITKPAFGQAESEYRLLFAAHGYTVPEKQKVEWHTAAVTLLYMLNLSDQTSYELYPVLREADDTIRAALCLPTVG